MNPRTDCNAARPTESPSIAGVALDLSGVLYVGDRLVAGAVESLARLRERGLALRFVTNVTRRSPAKVRAHLESLGLRIGRSELLTVIDAARSYVAQRDLNPYLLVHPDVRAEFNPQTDRTYDAVLVGDAGEFFNFEVLNEAFRVLMSGGKLLAMGNNRYFQDLDGLSLDVGPFVRALEFASGQRAVILGKPSNEFFCEAARSMQCAPSRVVMIGDDVDADVCGALNCGLQATLVRTGKYRTGDEQRLSRTPAVVCADIREAVELVLDRA